MSSVLSLLFLPVIASAALKCDGKDFACNHTDTHLVINSVHLESVSHIHWNAGDNVTATFSGHVKNYDIEDGTLFYDIWELGIKRKVKQGSLDYFDCDTHQCFRDRGKSLFLQHPEDKNSNFTAKITFELPPERVSGVMSINIWGHDQVHEPGVYDFVLNMRLHYKTTLQQQITVKHDPRKFCSVNADCPPGSYCLNDNTKKPIPVYWCQGVGGYCKGDADCPANSYCINYAPKTPIAYKYFCKE